MEKYRITCKDCGNVDMYEIITQVSHGVGDSLIMLIDVPVFYCTDCGNVAYRKELRLNEILIDSFKTGVNVVVFEDKDLREFYPNY